MSDSLADYSRLNSIISNSKLQTSNPAAFQVIKGLIANAQDSNSFIKQQFTDVNGQQTSIQQGLQGALDAVSSLDAEITALINTVADIVAELTTRNSSIYGASRYNSGTQSLSDGVEAVMVLNSTIFDTGGIHSGNTFVAPHAAQYMLSGQVAFTSDPAGIRRVRISSSGGINQQVAQLTGDPGGVDNTVVPFSLLVSLAIGESIQANLMQNSGGSLSAQGAMQIFRVSYV